MARESVQRKLERVRPPRVHVAYDIATGDAIERREVAFVIGVMGDYSGAAERSPLADRQFRQIDFDSFDQVLADLKPRVCFKIPSGLTGGEMTIDLSFQALSDFEPEHIVQQIPELDALRRSDSPEARDTIARHLDRVLHALEFKALEAAWRSLWYLVSHTETSSLLQIRVLDVRKKELLRDLQRAVEFDQSRLFKLLYEEPYGQFTADPFGLLLGDYFFGPSGKDIELLERIASIASTCHAPFIAGAAPSMLNLESFTSLSAPRDLVRAVQSTEFHRWQSFRRSEDARFIALALPRCLMRRPYGIRPGTPGDFEYEEDVRGGEGLLWGNAAFPFAACVANAFSRFGWCGAIRGLEGGGIVEGLPTWVSRSDDDTEVRSAIEVGITDRREKELSDIGFLPLVGIRNTDYAAFFSASSCAMPKQYSDDAANMNSRLSCQLPYVLTASRFVHYLKVIARDRLGSYHARGEWENYFNQWISSYVILDDSASPAIQAKFPLREARIEIAEHPARPGFYRLVAFLRPTFQLDELSVSLRVVTTIP